MSREILLTPPVLVTASGAQDLRLALDVLAFDVLDLELRVLNLTGSGPSIRVEIYTGMDVYSELGWVRVDAFSLVSSSPSSEVAHFTQFLRYIRWNITTFGGTGAPSATFLIRGVGRVWSNAALQADGSWSNAAFAGDSTAGDSGRSDPAFRGDVLVGPWCSAPAQMDLWYSDLANFDNNPCGVR